MKYTYSVESLVFDEWKKLFTETRDFCSGYLNRAVYDHPRPALRLVRSDGKIVFDVRASEDVCVGQIAGWPTAEQYERAAKNALEKAAFIREQTKKEEQRYENRKR